MRVKGGVMRAGRNTRLLLCITVIIVIAVFLSTFVFTGCGKRAMARELLKEKLEDSADLSSSTQAGSSEDKVESSSSSATASNSSEDEKIEMEDSGSSEDEIESEDDGLEENSDITAEDNSGEDNGAEDSEESGETVEVEESDEINARFAANIPFVRAECGNIIGGIAYTDPVIYPGDNGSGNLEVRGFISFDISELAGSQIESAKITGDADRVSGTPFEAYGPLIIKAVYWGARALQPADFNLDGIEITNNSAKNFGKSPAVLKDDLQNVVNSGINRYQLCFYFEMPQADGDGQADSISYFLEDIVLTVTYSK